MPRPADSERLRAACEERVLQLQAEVEARERQLSILAEVAARVHEEEDAGRGLEIALEVILRRLELRAGWVFLGRQSEGRLHLAASRGVAQAYLDEIRRNGLGECLCPEVFRSGHRMLARNTTQCPRMPTIVEGLSEPVAHACIPLQLEGEGRGVLNVAAPPGGLFSEADLRFLETVGHQLCIAMERAEHTRAERRRNQEARALAAINKAIGGSLDVDAILQAVGRTAREILAADRVQIFLGSDARSLTVAHLSGLPHPELKQGQPLDLHAVGARLQLAALERHETFWVDNWASDARVNEELARRWGAGAGIIVPLLARDKVLGLLAVTQQAPHRWLEEEVEVAEALAAQASVALENARLYEEARAAYRELKDAQRRILQSEKMALLGTFASGLAHEVRNPLNSIGLQLSILDRRVGRLPGGATRELSELLAVIREEIQRLDALVGDFLLFSRTNRVQYRLAKLPPLVDEVLRLLEPEAQQAGVRLKQERLDGSEPQLRVDAEKLKQVVINLVRNAIEAMPGGGGVVVETSSRDGQARIVVRDDGPGLPEGLDIFQLFVTTKPKGTGLGLSIAQQIVLEHGGEITASSEPGRGATFSVSLPLASLGESGADAEEP